MNFFLFLVKKFAIELKSPDFGVIETIKSYFLDLINKIILIKQNKSLTKLIFR